MSTKTWSLFVCLQSIEFWQEGENGELHINVKLYAKKDTHMVRTLTMY